jgi:hypothetical protein
MNNLFWQRSSANRNSAMTTERADPPKIRILILAVTGIAAFAVFWNIWKRTVASPIELRIHVSFLALGYTLFIGIALQDLARILASRSAPEPRSVAVFFLLASIVATIGYLFGYLWATKYGRLDALRRPILLIDSIVVGLAWFVVARRSKHLSIAYWDLVLGLGALLSWFLATVH